MSHDSQPGHLLWILLLGVVFTGIPAKAQFGDPPPWWDWLERDQRTIVPYDLNGDSIQDLEFRYYQSFEGTLLGPENCCFALVGVSWELKPLGETQLLVSKTATGTGSTNLLRIAAGELISAAPPPTQAWSSQPQRLGSYVAQYDSQAADITESDGPFGDSEGFVGVKLQTDNHTEVGWISLPKQLEGLFGRPQFSPAYRPTSSYVRFPKLQILAGQIETPEPTNPRLLPKDVDGDGIADFVIEEIWNSPIPESGELLQVSIKGLRGARILAAPTPEEGSLPRLAVASDGTLSVTAEETISPAPVADRELLGPQNRLEKRWAESERWTVLWQKNPATGTERGPLSGGGTLVMGGKLASQRCGWMRLGSPEGPFEHGGFYGYECTAVRETGKLGPVVKRADLNEDGLVDVIVADSTVYDFNPSTCGYMVWIEAYEPDLIPPTGYITIGSIWLEGQSGTNVPPDFMIPADRDLYQSEPFDGYWFTGGIYVDMMVCYTCERCVIPSLYWFNLAPNFIPIRIQKAGFWHSGWIGFDAGQLQFVINPVPGESTRAGQILNPTQPIPLTVEAMGDDLIFHWDSYLVNPVLQRKRLDEAQWIAVSSYDAWSQGLRLRLTRGDRGALYRLVY